MSDDAMERLAEAQVHDTAAGAAPTDRSPGGAAAHVVRIVGVTSAPLDLSVHESAIDHPRGGGRVVFTGVVRNRDGGRDVVALEYEAHPTAATVLTTVAEQFAARPDVLALAVSHRIGALKVGDIALVVAVATEHRRAAFAICAELVDEVKHRLPVWKRQVYTDGTDEWVNCP